MASAKMITLYHSILKPPMLMVSARHWWRGRVLWDCFNSLRMQQMYQVGSKMMPLCFPQRRIVGVNTAVFWSLVWIWLKGQLVFLFLCVTWAAGFPAVHFVSCICQWESLPHPENESGSLQWKQQILTKENSFSRFVVPRVCLNVSMTQ